MRHRIQGVNHWAGVLVASLLAGGCTAPQQAPGADAAAVRAEVEAVTAAFHQALRTDDAATLFTYVADDVVMAPPGEAPIRGKEAMQAWYAGFLSQYRTVSLTLADQEVFVGDGWAVESGGFEWALAPAAGGEPMVDRGTYMQVWQRTPEGKWQFFREVYNSSVPVAP